MLDYWMNTKVYPSTVKKSHHKLWKIITKLLNKWIHSMKMKKLFKSTQDWEASLVIFQSSILSNRHGSFPKCSHFQISIFENHKWRVSKQHFRSYWSESKWSRMQTNMGTIFKIQKNSNFVRRNIGRNLRIF